MLFGEERHSHRSDQHEQSVPIDFSGRFPAHVGDIMFLGHHPQGFLVTFRCSLGSTVATRSH